MDAHVHRSGGEWFVNFTLAGEPVDEAGPFADEVEAIFAAERGVFGGGGVTLARAAFGQMWMAA